MSRRKVSFCFDYNPFDSETKLELAESRILKLSKTKSGKNIFGQIIMSCLKKIILRDQ